MRRCRCHLSHVVRVARLLKHSMDANRIRSDQCRPLRVASYCGKLGVVQLLLERGTKVDAEAWHQQMRHTLALGRIQIPGRRHHLARLLLERDLDVSARGEEKWTPFHAASYYGKLEIFRVVNTNVRKMVSALYDYYSQT
ncbi:hypothetical protein EDB83DRAFT_2409718 [Lactarius deliciosus]|nr:hypothetical protein EDB83DRAFT_2409718 [Lactarius deliciosus]